MSPADIRLKEARGKLESGNLFEAERLVRQVLAKDSGNAQGMVLLAHVALTAGAVDDALRLTTEALAAGHSSGELHTIRGLAFLKRGELIDAVESLKTASQTALPLAVELEWVRALRDLGQLRLARERAAELMRANSGSEAAQSLLFEVAAREFRTQLPFAAEASPSAEAAAPAAGGTCHVSVIICSVNPAKFARISLNYSTLLRGIEHEIILIDDARSLCEGYNRGIARSRGEILVFSHDDIEILSEDFAQRLLAHFEQFDVIGVVGTTYLVDGAWGLAGWPHSHGQIVHADRVLDIYAVTLFRVCSPVVADVQALDGLFFAARRHVLERIGFDAETFDGFHLYDLDFTFRAFHAGFKLAVCNDIVISHDSRGKFDAAYEGFAHRFLAKHRSRLTLQRGAVADVSEASFASAAQALAFCRRWLAIVVGDRQSAAADDRARAGLPWQLTPRAHGPADRMERYQPIQALAGLVTGRPATVLGIGCDLEGLTLALRARLPEANVLAAPLRAVGSPQDEQAAAVAHVEVDLALAQGGAIDLFAVDGVLERMQNPWNLLLQLRELASPGAALVLTASNGRNFVALAEVLGTPQVDERAGTDVRVLRRLTLRELRVALAQTGWRVHRVGALIDPRAKELLERRELRPSGHFARWGRVTVEGLDAFELHELCSAHFLISATADNAD